MDDIERRRGRYLPHWTRKGASYFVTFRLEDSLPREVVEGICAEYQRLTEIEKNLAQHKLDTDEIRRQKNDLRRKLEKYLDAGYGACYLARTGCPEIMRETLLFFDGDRYLLGAWAVMPNHVHVIVQPTTHRLDQILHSWKRHSALEINRHLGRSGTLWLSESFDHLIRSEEKFQGTTRYILDNPVNAGLRDWPWTGVGKLGDGRDPES